MEPKVTTAVIGVLIRDEPRTRFKYTEYGASLIEFYQRAVFVSRGELVGSGTVLWNGPLTETSGGEVEEISMNGKRLTIKEKLFSGGPDTAELGRIRLLCFGEGAVTWMVLLTPEQIDILEKLGHRAEAQS